MADLYLVNACPFPITNAGEGSTGDPVSIGDNWQTPLPSVAVAPGAFAPLGTLSRAGTMRTTCGWLNLQLQESPPKPIQVYAYDDWDVGAWNEKDVHTCLGGIGPGLAQNSRNGSAWNAGLPNGGAQASMNPWYAPQGHTYVLINVYRGYAAGIAALQQAIDLPCAVGVSLLNSQQTLFVVGAEPRDGGPPTIYVASCTLPTDQAGGQSTDPEGTLNDPKNWQVAPFAPSVLPPLGDHGTASALSHGAFAPIGDSIAYFWNQADYSNSQVGWRFLSSQRQLWNQSEIWGYAAEMRDFAGKAITSGGFTCGPYTSDSTWIVPDVACIGVPNGTVVAGMITPNPASGQLELVLYRYLPSGVIRTRTYPDAYAWPAAAPEQRIPIADLAAACGIDPAAVGLGLSLDWYTTGDADGLRTWLVVALAEKGIGAVSTSDLGWASRDISQDGNAGVLIFETDENFTLLNEKPIGCALTSVHSVPVVQRDASGRVWVLWNGIGSRTWPVQDQTPGFPFEVLFSATLPSDTTPSASSMSQQFSAPREWGPVQRIGRTAVPFWWMSPVSQQASWVDVDGDQQALPLPSGAKVSRNPIYQFLFHDSRPLDCAVQLVGWGEKVSNVDLGQAVTAEDKTLIQVQGIVDGPMPIPPVNAKAQILTGGTSAPYTVMYGKGSSTAQSYTNENSRALGFQSSGAFTVGVGAAWDTSFDRATTLETSATVTDARDTNQPFPSHIDSSSKQVSPAAWALTTQVSLMADRFQLVEPDPSDPSVARRASGAAVYLAFLPRFMDGPLESFNTYIVDPNDLHSYTSERITQRMTQLGLYTGNDYVTEVLLRNSVPLVPKNDGSPVGGPNPAGATFNLSWNRGALGGSGTAQSNTRRFTEQGWSYSAKVYAGLSFGFSVGGNTGIFSIGMGAFNCEALGGTEFSSSHDTSQSTDDSWQLSVESNDNGLSWDPDQWDPDKSPLKNPVGACLTYDFTVYFLPANTQWIEELITGLTNTKTSQPSGSLDPQTIDPGSAPWRIAFVVTQITECTSVDSNNKPVFTTTYPKPDPSGA